MAGGFSTIALVTEDVFRYGGSARAVRPAALIDLLSRMRERVGGRFIQTDHANVTSVAAYSDEDLRTVRRLLAGRDERGDYVWLNLGVETASGALLAGAGGRGKMGGCAPEQWAGFCAEQVRRLCRGGFFPLVSLVVGLPGETPDDVRRTLEWVESIGGERAAVFPMLCAPIDGGEPFGRRQMGRDHWQLIRRCYRMNFKWTPRLVWNNQSRVGVPLWRRLVLQCLGRLQVLWWKGLFVWRSGRLLP